MNKYMDSNTQKFSNLKLVNQQTFNFLTPNQRQQITEEVERLNCVLAIKNKYKLSEKICQTLQSLNCAEMSASQFKDLLAQLIVRIHHQTWSATRKIDDQVRNDVSRELKNLKQALKEAGANLERAQTILNNAQVEFDIDEVLVRREVSLYTLIVSEIKSRIKMLSASEYRISKLSTDYIKHA